MFLRDHISFIIRRCTLTSKLTASLNKTLLALQNVRARGDYLKIQPLLSGCMNSNSRAEN